MKRIYILGAGPSLLKQQHLLSAFAMPGYDTFTCNGLTGWSDLPFTPTHHGVTDVSDEAELVELLFADRFPDTVRWQVAFAGDPKVAGYNRVFKQPDDQQIWSTGFKGLGNHTTQGLPTGRCSPLTLAQVAAILGYRSFVFLGLDTTMKGYPWDPGAKRRTDRRFIQAVQRCFWRARFDIEEAGGEIIDATPGGYLNETWEGGDQPPSRYRPILPYQGLEALL